MTGEPMPAPEVTREDLKRVEDRAEFVAQEVDGEKLLSRYILKQVRQNGDDLAAIKTRVDRIEEKVEGLDQKIEGLDQKVDRLDQKVDRLEQKVDRLETDLRGLRSDFNSSQEKLPGVIAEVMREVLRENRR
jgi:peptidoglycan hydrolase CwlO-like protein